MYPGDDYSKYLANYDFSPKIKKGPSTGYLIGDFNLFSPLRQWSSYLGIGVRHHSSPSWLEKSIDQICKLQHTLQFSISLFMIRSMH